MCRVGGSGTPIVVRSQAEVNCVCYRIVTRGVLPALLMRFSGAAGLIGGFFVRQKNRIGILDVGAGLLAKAVGLLTD